jgi:glc operon protein GlcG
MPVVVDGQVVGAIGVSGASSADEDQELAVIGASSTGAPPRAGGATHIPADAVARRFATGGLLVDEPSFQVDAGRREAPGEAEEHEHTVDVMRVVAGAATVVTGGELVDPHDVAPGERRASAIAGGTAHELGEGDVLAVPSRVPHQFTAVSDPFLYYVVKVAA